MLRSLSGVNENRTQLSPVPSNARPGLLEGMHVLRAVGTAGLGLLCLMPCFAQNAFSTPQPHATNYVLELDGTGGYVELPPNIFNDLEEATVEAWVRWDDFSGAAKRFFNYGDAQQDMSVMSEEATVAGDSATLGFAVCDGAQKDVKWVDVPAVLRTGKWCHVAAVSGKDGMRLYLNGSSIRFHVHGLLSEIFKGIG